VRFGRPLVMVYVQYALRDEFVKPVDPRVTHQVTLSLFALFASPGARNC